jgi:predicted anti-sigma-YlaC factor YlaD
MNEHPTDNLITAYADGAAPEAELAGIEAHLNNCESCQHELEAVRDLKLRLAKMPHRYAPPELISSLQRTFTKVSIWARWRQTLARPWVWTPLSAVALLLILFGVWIQFQNRSSEENFIDLEPLLTAHSRYSTESSFSAPDIHRWDYSARLASYYQNEE